MKAIDEYYLASLAILMIGLPLLLYLKLSQPDVVTYNLAIYGNKADASMLAYYLDKQVRSKGWDRKNVLEFNITMIEPPEEDVEDERDELDKQIVSFCGVQRQWMKFLDDSNLQYNIEPYGVYYGQMVVSGDGSEFSIYSTQSPFYQSLVEYGLSRYAIKNFFLEFAKVINKTDTPRRKYKLEELTTVRLVRETFPGEVKEEGLRYFSDGLGLDQRYIKKFIVPVVWGNYMHETNSFSSLYKLLPVFCHKSPEIGQSLVLFETPRKIKDKLLSSVKHVKMNFISKKRLETYSIYKDGSSGEKKVNAILTKDGILHGEDQNQLMISNQTVRTYLKIDSLFIFDNAASVGGKAVSYYKTIIDGKIKDEHLYEDFFTIYLKYTPKIKQQMHNDAKKEKGDSKSGSKSSYNPIYSISRVCADRCKGFQSSVYVLISKHKLTTTKALNMFEFHNIVYYKKFYKPQSQFPTNKKIRENENVYKIYDIASFTDSYELQLNMVSQIAEAFIRKIENKYF